jgi:tight adherence protein B
MHLPSLPIIVSTLTALAMITVIFGLSREVQHRRNRVLDRLREMDERRRGDLAEIVGEAEAGKLISALSRVADRVGLEQQLKRAKLPFTAGEFLLLIGIFISVGFVLSIVLHNPFLAIIAVAGGVWGPRWWIDRRRAKRIRDFDKQLAPMVALLVNAIRSGSNLQQAVEMAGRQSPPPMSDELARVLHEMHYGASFKDALLRLTEDIPSADLQLLVTALGLQSEVGGNLVPMLERISEVIRERVQLQAEIRALTAQQRYSGYVVALMPVALGGLLMVFNPSYILNVFRSTVWCGWTMFGVAGIMIVVGVVVIQKVVDIRV